MFFSHTTTTHIIRDITTKRPASQTTPGLHGLCSRAMARSPHIGPPALALELKVELVTTLQQRVHLVVKYRHVNGREVVEKVRALALEVAYDPVAMGNLLLEGSLTILDMNLQRKMQEKMRKEEKMLI